MNYFPPSISNQITKDYYNFLVGEINRGTIKASVLKTEDSRFPNNNVKYFLTSVR